MDLSGVRFDPSLKTVDLSTIPDLALVLSELARGPQTASKGWFQKRGYGLERLVHEALVREGLNARTASPASNGDQIDGALEIDNRFSIFECKWEKSPISSTTLVTFQGKVDRRLVGTVGLFISASGFAEASDAYLKSSRALNTILIDYADLEYALSSSGSMLLMLRNKIRRAAWDGVVYWRDPEIRKAIIDLKDTRGLIVVTQGPRDEALLTRIVETLARDQGRSFSVRIVAAYGVYQTNALAEAIQALATPSIEVIALVDADGLSDTEVSRYWEAATPSVDLMIANPSIEEWFRGDYRDNNGTLERFVDKVLATSANADLLPGKVDDLQRGVAGFTAPRSDES